MKAKDIMTAPCAVISPDNSVKRAVELMLRRDVSGLPVVDDAGQIVGIITEGDLLRRAELGNFHEGEVKADEVDRASAYMKSWSWRVGDVMSRGLQVATEDTGVSELASLMASRGIKRIPIVRDGKLIGIVSRKDLLRAICSASRQFNVRTAEGIARSIRARLSYDLDIPRDAVGVSVSEDTVHVIGHARSEAELNAIRALIDNVDSTAKIILEVSPPPPATSNKTLGSRRE